MNSFDPQSKKTSLERFMEKANKDVPPSPLPPPSQQGKVKYEMHGLHTNLDWAQNNQTHPISLD